MIHKPNLSEIVSNIETKHFNKKVEIFRQAKKVTAISRLFRRHALYSAVLGRNDDSFVQVFSNFIYLLYFYGFPFFYLFYQLLRK